MFSVMAVAHQIFKRGLFIFLQQYIDTIYQYVSYMVFSIKFYVSKFLRF